MRNLFRFIIRNYFFFLFILLEGLAFTFIAQYNSYQKSHFVKYSRSTALYMNTSVRSFHKYFSLREENDILSAENARLRNLLERERAAFSASKIITDTVIAQDTSVLNDSIRKVNYFYIPAMVVNNSVNKQNNLITIDKGAKDGVYTEMAVISDEGVVGIVTRTSEHFARVLPILNRNFRLSAKIKRNNYFGIIEWDGVSAESVPLKEIPVHVDIQPGDTIVTSGYSAIFPEGIHIGVVEKVSPTDGNFSDVKVQLLTDFRKLVHVYLVKYNYKQEHQALENEIKK